MSGAMKILGIVVLLLLAAGAANAWIPAGPGAPAAATCSGGTLDFSQSCNSALSGAL